MFKSRRTAKRLTAWLKSSIDPVSNAGAYSGSKRAQFPPSI